MAERKEKQGAELSPLDTLLIFFSVLPGPQSTYSLRGLSDVFRRLHRLFAREKEGVSKHKHLPVVWKEYYEECAALPENCSPIDLQVMKWQYSMAFSYSLPDPHERLGSHLSFLSESLHHLRNYDKTLYASRVNAGLPKENALESHTLVNFYLARHLVSVEKLSSNETEDIALARQKLSHRDQIGIAEWFAENQVSATQPLRVIDTLVTYRITDAHSPIEWLLMVAIAADTLQEAAAIGDWWRPAKGDYIPLEPNTHEYWKTEQEDAYWQEALALFVRKEHRYPWEV